MIIISLSTNIHTNFYPIHKNETQNRLMRIMVAANIAFRGILNTNSKISTDKNKNRIYR
jgi:hypothetical protein